ncbi:sphingolipid transporter [Aureococcus anophagefferens]|nr:sphingolipid transporter [Aureococcus anophagefferens]
MATSLGWRDACFLIAALGFGLALEGLGVAERRCAAKPAGGDAGAPAPGPPKKTFKQALAAIFGNRLVVLVFAASSLRYMGGSAISGAARGYLPTFYGVVFPGYDDEYSYINAYVVATGFLAAAPAAARRAGPRGQAPTARARAARGSGAWRRTSGAVEPSAHVPPACGSWN